MNRTTPPLLVRYAAARADRLRCLPHAEDWLTAAEQRELSRFRAERRRNDWLAGRWLAKQTISQTIGPAELRNIELLTRDQRGLGVVPQVRVAGRTQPWSLSLSHADSRVLVGLSLVQGLTLGVDLACDVPLDERFRRRWFTPGEQRWVADSPAERTSLVWGLKEACFKACGAGRPWIPQQIEVLPGEGNEFRAVVYGQRLDRVLVRSHRVERGQAVVVCVPPAGWQFGSDECGVRRVELN